MKKYEEADKIMWEVFKWANDNDIEVRLFNRYDYGNIKYPVLRFIKDNKNIERGFYPMTDITGQIDSMWREVAFALCVIPLDLSGLK